MFLYHIPTDRGNHHNVAVHRGVMMADTLSFNAKIGVVNHKSDRKSCVIPTADRNTQYRTMGL